MRTIFNAWLTGIAASMLLCPAMAQQEGFTIWKDGRQVGAITAIRRSTGPDATYAVSSVSELALVTKHQVSSTLAMSYRNGSPWSCFTALRVNGTLRDSSLMKPGTEGLECYVHPNERFMQGAVHPWCTARLYFEEPVGQQGVFVESLLQERPVKDLGEGLYQVDMTGGKTNTYRYVGGVLQEVEVDRPLLKLVFRRG
jgi:hypothetical protein